MNAGLSIITTIRGHEPKARATLIDARAKAGCKTEIIAVFDGCEYDSEIEADQILMHKAARGIGASRHRGIKEARYATVLLIDAHMNFEHGFGLKILKHFQKKAHQQDIVCGRCVPAMLDLTPVEDTGGGYTGGRFALKTYDGADYWSLSAKWADQAVNQPVGCVIGASYAFRRKWYSAIGEPLELLAGWGGDEEYLSIASWLAGGRCFLLDFWASHIFRDKPSFDWNRTDAMIPSLNRLRLLDLFPCSKDMKDDLRAHHLQSLRVTDAEFEAMYDADRKRPEVKKAAKLWAGWAKNVDAFLADWTDADGLTRNEKQGLAEHNRPWKSTKPATTTPAAARVQQRAYIVCANCGEKNSFRVDRSAKINGVRHRYGKCTNHHCQTRGVMIDRADGQIIHWGRAAANIF